MDQHRCPDCGVTMAEVDYLTGGYEMPPKVNTGEKREGLLGKLGFDENAHVTTVMCPECGLLRQYANVEE